MLISARNESCLLTVCHDNKKTGKKSGHQCVTAIYYAVKLHTMMDYNHVMINTEPAFSSTTKS